MSLEASRQVLLTGAGFTKDFGGFLAKEMWSLIFSHSEVADHKILQDKLRKQLNFEIAYNQILDSSHISPDCKIALTHAVQNAYQKIHASFYLQDIINRATYACKGLVAPFCSGSAQERGFVFTLNQDLFLERFYSNGSYSLYDLSIPGLNNFSFFNFSLPKILTNEHLAILPDESKVQKLESDFWTETYGRFSYLKLHGSYSWRTREGSEVMVIGTQKTGLIDKTPYLKWSHSIFQQVLSRPNRSLLVIGYGFGDEHINDVIAHSILTHGTHLHVVSPMDHTSFENYMMPSHGVLEKNPPKHGEILWNGLTGYHQGRVTDLYSHNGNLTPLGESVLEGMGLF